MAIARWNMNREVATVQNCGNALIRDLNEGEAPAAAASFVAAGDTHEDAKMAGLQLGLPGTDQRNPDVRLEHRTPLTAAWEIS
jgi:hypothetical protein